MTNKLVVQDEGIPEYYIVDGPDEGPWNVIDPATSQIVAGPFEIHGDAEFKAGYLDGQRHFGRMGDAPNH